MCPRHVGGRYPTPGFNGEGLSALSRLPFDTHDLTQRVHHVHQIALSLHHCVDGLVGHRRFVDDIRVLTALHSRSCLRMVVEREATLGLRERHGASSSLATAHETFRIALATHDVRTRSHAARNDPHVSLTSAYSALAGDEHVLAIMVLPGHIVVLAAPDFHMQGSYGPTTHRSLFSQFGWSLIRKLRLSRVISHTEYPQNLPLRRSVLMVILRRKGLLVSMNDFMSTSIAAVY